jgi:hydrogenase maturation protease
VKENRLNAITILGLGNILLQDEGFGVHFVRWFSERYRLPDHVRLMEGGTLAYNLLDIICNCDYLIVIDVLKADDTPGSTYRFTREEMEIHLPPPTSAHEVQFQDVLIKADLLEQAPEVVFLCIVPEAYDEFQLEMTPTMQERFPIMENLLIKELSARGADAVRID